MIWRWNKDWYSVRVIDRFEAGTALLAGIMLIAVSAGVLVSESTQVGHDSSRKTRTGLTGLISKILRTDPDALDVSGGVYGGYTVAHNSDVILQQPNGTDMVLSDVSWNSEANKMPPYHGFRGTWWLPFRSSLGAMADLVYVKVVADRDRMVRQSGTRDAMPVPEMEAPSATFRRLEFTDGLNLLSGNIIYRMPYFGRAIPYIGLGAGFSLPHAEVQRRGGASQKTFSFQLAGISLHLFAGMELHVAKSGSVFTEYRLSYATNKVQLIDGGTLQTNLWISHFTAGGSGNIRPALAQPVK
jgi:lipid A oxidase